MGIILRCSLCNRIIWFKSNSNIIRDKTRDICVCINCYEEHKDIENLVKLGKWPDIENLIKNAREAKLLCLKCGTFFEVNDNFCGKCGQKVRL